MDLFVSTLLFLFLLVLEMASDCHELFLRGETTSGVYTIQPMNAEPFKVFCEMTAGKCSKTSSHFAFSDLLSIGWPTSDTDTTWAINFKQNGSKSPKCTKLVGTTFFLSNFSCLSVQMVGGQ